MKERQKLSSAASESSIYKVTAIIEELDSIYKGLALLKSRIKPLFKGLSKSNLINYLRTMKDLVLFYSSKCNLNKIEKSGIHRITHTT